MIDDALYLEDQESYDLGQDYKISRWKQIIREQHDLIYFGRCSYIDVEQMTPIERDTFLEFTKERRDEESSSLSDMFKI